MPAIVLVHDSFERVARAQAVALGAPDLLVYGFPQHSGDDPGGLDESEAIRAVRTIGHLLVPDPRENGPAS